jgi:hypothetical protein
VSRYKKTVFMLVAAVMLLAAGTSVNAETVAAKQRRERGDVVVVRKHTSALPSWWRIVWAGLKSRYAMAAN